jgi:polysaccharide biosynthesis transport protein
MLFAASVQWRRMVRRDERPTMELSGYFAVARRWWTTLLIATLVAGFAGYFIASGVPSTYESTTRLLVGPVVGDVDVMRAAGAISYTYAELAVSEPALDTVRDSLGLPAETPIVARAIPNETTRILQIRAEYGDPNVAASISNLLSENLIEIETSGVVLPEGQLSVVEPAVANPAPIAPQVSLIAIIAGAAGLLAAIVLVLLVEYFGNTVNSRRDLAELSGVPVLGFAALGRRFRPSRRQPTIVDAMPESSAASAVRFIATKIAYVDPNRPTSSVLIVGTATRDGAADLAVGVATSLARSGRRVVLVDANEERGEITELLGAEGPGLSDLLARPDLAPRDVALIRPRWPAVIPKGETSENQLVDPDAARRVISSLHRQFDIVVIGAAPIHLSGNALVWAQAAGSVVLTAERDRARRDDVTYALENLAAVKSSVLGTVLLDHAPRRRRDPAPPPARAQSGSSGRRAVRASAAEGDWAAAAAPDLDASVPRDSARR